MFKVVGFVYCIFFLSSCATPVKYSALERMDIVGNGTSIKCVQDANGSFSSWKECYDSDEFKKAKTSLDERETQNLKEAEIKRKKEIKKVVSKNKSFKKFEKVAIDKEVQIGMPEELVYLSWGKPKNVNRSVGSYGVHKQLIYGERTYLYIENGLLKSWQD